MLALLGFTFMSPVFLLQIGASFIYGTGYLQRNRGQHWLYIFLPLMSEDDSN